jgi:thioredoxin reductase (NADPH)
MHEVPATRPVVMAVDDDADVLGALDRDLQRRYDRDYDVVAVDSPAAAVPVLEGCRAQQRRLALVIAAQWPPA